MSMLHDNYISVKLVGEREKQVQKLRHVLIFRDKTEEIFKLFTFNHSFKEKGEVTTKGDT